MSDHILFIFVSQFRYSFIWWYPADTDVSKTSSGCFKKITTSYDQTRRPKDVWQMTSHLRRLENVWFTSSWRRLIYVLLKTSDLRCLENACYTTSWRRRIFVLLKTSDLQCLEEVCFTTSWRRLIYNVLKMSVERRLCGNVVATSKQRRKK